MQPILIRPVENETGFFRFLILLHELRPHLAPEMFLPTIRRLQNEGYFLAVLESEGSVAAVAGCRFGDNPAHGKSLFVDDFMTPVIFRAQGYGQKLLDWLAKLAELSGCQGLQLDSHVQRTEAKFHKKQPLRPSGHPLPKLKPAC